MAKRKLQAHLEVETEAGAVLGGARIACSRRSTVRLDFERRPANSDVLQDCVRDALDDLNNLADFPVIERSIGGAGGGTKLTDYGPNSWRCFVRSRTSIRRRWTICIAKPLAPSVILTTFG
jgi:hypothetical protein